MKVDAVVVTYNRVDCLKKNLKCLLNQSYEIHNIYVIDNASMDETKTYLTNLSKECKKIHYIRLESNTGGAGGFYVGIKTAYESGADYIWGMDDDAYPEKNALKNLITDGVERYGSRECYWSNCDNDLNFETVTKSVREWMFVGFLLPREVISRIGLPRKEFFIYLDDYEYAYRIRKKGYKIYKVKTSEIEHRAGTQNFYPEKKIGIISLRWIKLPDWKYYYWVRNYILLYSWLDYNKYITLLLKIPKIYIFTLIFEKRKEKIFRKAFLHGISGKAGKYDLSI